MAQLQLQKEATNDGGNEYKPDWVRVTSCPGTETLEFSYID